LSIPAFAQQSNQEAFKSTLLEAIQKNDPEILMSITCLDGVTDDWKKMLAGSTTSCLAQMHNSTNAIIEFTPNTGPVPEPIKYQDKLLVENITITTICTVKLPADPHNGKMEFKLGEKNGKLLIGTLIPK
jgi:hypothetical protein